MQLRVHGLQVCQCQIITYCQNSPAYVANCKTTSNSAPYDSTITPQRDTFLGDRLQNGSPYPIGPLSCLSVCDVGALWPDSWMYQDETWHAGRPRPRPRCGG